MRSPASYLRGIQHPEGFHGNGKTRNYFEGWYFKIVSEDQRQKWAVIPGIFRGLGGSSRDEAFVQVLDGSTGRSWYHVYPVTDFSASETAFDVRVGDNHFSSSGATLNLLQLKGRLEITSEFKPWPVTLASPGIMGWYGLVPFMECFHGIVSFSHSLAGSLEVEGNQENFSGGKGYIEKDWGRNFPSGYIWLHSNHLSGANDASLIASAAIIPWLGKPFRGFIMGLHHSGKLHSWTTYNKSKEEWLKVDDTHINWKVSGPSGELELRAERKRGGLLHAPLREAMHQRVEETLDGVIEVKHTQAGKVLLEATATTSGMEVFGDIERLLRI
jgi:tocopherol cyclase